MSKEKVTILGSGTCVPSLYRSSSALLIEGKTEKILLDLGIGTIHQLLKKQHIIDDIDIIMLSHFHPDHSSELPAFIFSTKYPSPMRRRKPFTVVAGEGVCNFYHNLNIAFDNNLLLKDSIFKLEELPDQGWDEEILNDFILEWTVVKHREESRAYRLTSSSGFIVVFSGDTDYSENLISIAKDADILFCESAFPDSHKVEGHLTPSLAGEIASQAGVKHLVLTHFYPMCEEYNIEAQCRDTYKGKLTLAEDFMEFFL